MISTESVPHRLPDEDVHLLHRLRAARRHGKRQGAARASLGARVSDSVAAAVGSWPFILIQSVILIAWMGLNVTAYISSWDPYPFILPNLVLSFQAAYAAPFIMMSQNRQAAIDRGAAETDYEVNRKSELEIELLHQKIDLLRQTEIAELINIIRILETRLRTAGLDHASPLTLPAGPAAVGSAG